MSLSGHDDGMRQAIEGAIYREIGARDFYRKISEHITNPEGREKFSRLSKDEEGHRVKLEGLYEKLFGDEHIQDEEKVRQSEIAGVEISEKTGALAALDVAIKAEAHAIDFYTDQAGRAEDAELRDLFLGFADEEKGHYNLLEAERNSLIGGFYWFDMDSTPFLED
jgi:rubrerythrin